MCLELMLLPLAAFAVFDNLLLFDRVGELPCSAGFSFRLSPTLCRSLCQSRCRSLCRSLSVASGCRAGKVTGATWGLADHAG